MKKGKVSWHIVYGFKITLVDLSRFLMLQAWNLYQMLTQEYLRTCRVKLVIRFDEGIYLDRQESKI